MRTPSQKRAKACTPTALILRTPLVLLLGASSCYTMAQDSNSAATELKKQSTAAIPLVTPALSNYLLNEGRSVPGVNADGAAATKTKLGHIVYGNGVSISPTGKVFQQGKLVKQLAPGESLSAQELEQLTGKAETTIAPNSNSAALNNYQLKDGRSVPATDADGAAATRTKLGHIVYDNGVSVSPAGKVFQHGKLVKQLAPGESLSSQELAQLTGKSKTTRPGNTGDSERPPVGRSDIPATPGAEVIGAGNAGSLPGARPTPSSPAPQGGVPRAQPGTSSSGEDVFVLGNGTQVPADLGNGVTGTPNESGGIDYSDGRSAGVDPATGDTVFSNGDGSEAGRYTPATPGVGTNPDGSATDTWVMPNGDHVPRERGGGAGVPNERGGVNYPDGSHTEYDSDTGETVFFDAEGAEIDRSQPRGAYPSHTDNGDSVFVLGNGQTVPRTGPDGRPGTPNDHGGVDYGDGTSVNPSEGGRTVVTGGSHGSYIAVEESTDGNGNATFDLGNGTSVPATGAGGRGHISESGSGVEYEDGTYVTVDAKTGDTVIMRPDGSSEVMRGSNNRDAAAEYVRVTSGGASTGSGSNRGSSSGNSSSNSGGKGKNNSNGKDTGSSGNKDNKNDKDNSGGDKGDKDSSDDKGDDGGGKDAGKDTKDDSSGKGADKNVGAEGPSGNQPEGKKVVDSALARKTGEEQETEDNLPPGCGESGGRGGPPGGVAEPGIDERGCVPGGSRPGGSDDEEEQPSDGPLNPILGNSLDRDDLTPDDLVGQPGVDGIEDNGGTTLDEKLIDIDGVTNPTD